MRIAACADVHGYESVWFQKRRLYNTGWPKNWHTLFCAR